MFLQVDTHRIHYDEVSLVSTFHHTPATIRTALALLSSGDVPAAEFIAAHAPLTELPHVLASLADGSNRAIKTSIQ